MKKVTDGTKTARLDVCRRCHWYQRCRLQAIMKKAADGDGGACLGCKEFVPAGKVER